MRSRHLLFVVLAVVLTVSSSSMGVGLTTPDAAAGVVGATAPGLFNIRPLSIFTGHCNASIARGATIWKAIPGIVDIFFPKVVRETSFPFFYIIPDDVCLYTGIVDKIIRNGCTRLDDEIGRLCGKHQRRNSFLLFIYFYVFVCVCWPALTHCVSHSHLFDFHFFSFLEIFSLPRVSFLLGIREGEKILKQSSQHTQKKKNRKMTVESIK